jgi:hypothetical protein
LSKIEIEQLVLKRIKAQVLTLLIVKGKGRPKGSKGKQKGHRELSKYLIVNLL